MLKRLFQWVMARKADEGVTLIELLAVIVILAIIAGIAIPVVLGSINSAKVSTTQQNLNIIAEALNRYNADHGSYPTATGWVTLSSEATALAPYLSSIPNDGWTGEFVYSSNGTTFSVATPAGATGLPSGFTVPSGDGTYYITNSSSVTDGDVAA